jgi:hypothetical protein
MEPRKVIWPAEHDPRRSVDLIDGNRTNKSGGPYYVAVGILPKEVASYWEEYVASLDHSPSKQEVYAIAAAIQRESGDRLIAVPCEDGNGVAVSNGTSVWFVEPTEVSTPEALHAHVTRWLNTSSTPEPQLNKGTMGVNSIEHEL